MYIFYGMKQNGFAYERIEILRCINVPEFENIIKCQGIYIRMHTKWNEQVFVLAIYTYIKLVLMCALYVHVVAARHSCASIDNPWKNIYFPHYQPLVILVNSRKRLLSFSVIAKQSFLP